MTHRFDYTQKSPELFKQYLALSQATQGALEQSLYDLVSLRTAQMNGCVFCLDMHVKEAKIHGERELRMYHLPLWRESPLFNARERAVLAWTEVLTRLPEEGVPDALYQEVREQLSEKELAALSFLVVVANGWNRLNVGFGTPPGRLDEAYGLTKAGLK